MNTLVDSNFGHNFSYGTKYLFTMTLILDFPRIAFFYRKPITYFPFEDDG